MTTALLAAGLVAGGALGGAATDAGPGGSRPSSPAATASATTVYLDRDDTNGRDELTVRGRLALQPGTAGSWASRVLHADLDNGFDAFAPDNSFDTLSDRPGRDAQRSSGRRLTIIGDRRRRDAA